MVAYVLPDSRQIRKRSDASCMQLVCRPDTRVHQQVWGADTPRRQDHLIGFDPLSVAFADQLDSGCRVVREDDPSDNASATHLEIRARPTRHEVSDRGTVANTAKKIGRNGPDAPRIWPIYVGSVCVAQLGARLEKGH